MTFLDMQEFARPGSWMLSAQSTELLMYPGRSHGTPDLSNQLVKAVSKMAWMDFTCAASATTSTDARCSRRSRNNAATAPQKKGRAGVDRTGISALLPRSPSEP